jgi:hypothetical protein
MDIDAIQEKSLVNEWLREHYSEVAKTEPATWQDQSTNYHKENFEYERTRHTHHDTHEDIPEPGQKKTHHHWLTWINLNNYLNDQTSRIHHKN